MMLDKTTRGRKCLQTRSDINAHEERIWRYQQLAEKIVINFPFGRRSKKE